MNEKSWFRLTKIDAARRQLDMASFLFLVAEEFVSVHALASSAYQVLEDINRHQGGPPLFKDGFGGLDEPSREWRNWLNVPQNFIKHAERDPDGAIRFRPWVTVMTLVEAAAAFKRLTGDRPVVTVGAVLWIERMLEQDREDHEFLEVAEVRLVQQIRSRYREDQGEQFYMDLAEAAFKPEQLFSRP